MPTVDDAGTLAAIGVIVLSTAIIFNYISLFHANSRAFMSLHFLGASLFCLACWLIGSLPLIALTGLWAFSVLIALVLKTRSNGPVLPPPRPGTRRYCGRVVAVSACNS